MASSTPLGGAWCAGCDGSTQRGTPERRYKQHTISGIAVEKDKETVGGGTRESRGGGSGRGWMEAGVCGQIVKTTTEGKQAQGGGYRYYSQEDTQFGVISISEPLPPELWGGLQVLKRVPGDKLAILSNSRYLLSGAQGQVHLWNAMAWIGKGGGDQQHPYVGGTDFRN